MQNTSMGEARTLFCRKLVEAREARKKGGETKQNNGGGRLIMEAKVWL
jgi:molybdenum-dependent DNA-binding transcriptional regulator ModE